MGDQIFRPESGTQEMKRLFLFIGIVCFLWGCAGLDHSGKNAGVSSQGSGVEVIGEEQNAKK